MTIQNEISPYLERAFKRFYENILDSKILSSFFQSEAQIEHLIDKQKINFESYFTESEEAFQLRYERLGKIHYNIHVPLVNVLAGLDFLKNEILVQLIQDNKITEKFFHITSVFDTMKNYISKGYMDSTLENYLTDIISQKEDNFFFKELIKWTEQFGEAIKKSDETLFPETEIQNSPIERWFSSNEFRLICGDEKTVDVTIREIHQSFYNTAKSIRHYVISKKYFESAILIDKLLKLSYRLIGVIRNIYLDYANNKEDRFFQFVEKEVKVEDVNYITVVNIKKLSAVNEMFGKATGDAILDAAEKFLKSILINYDPNTIVMKGVLGDFYIFFKDIPKEDAEALQIRISNSLNLLENKTLGIRIGVAVAMIELSQHTQLSKEELQSIANFAKEKARNSGEDAIFIEKEVIENDILSSHLKKYKNAKFITHAISEKQIDIFFQPICSSKTKAMHHVEALARLKDGDRIIPAGAFIDLIYEMGLIVDLDTQVLEKVIVYKERLKKVTNKVFVNVSPESIKSEKFLMHLLSSLDILKKSGLETVIELTEQAFLDNIKTIKCVHEAFNINFAVDDFGTGYSSLKTVLDLSETGTISYLKIDGSLIKDISDSENRSKIVQTIALMSLQMALKNIAEFVENEAVLKVLEKIGIEYVQGFYLSKPLPIDQLEGLKILK